MITSDCVLEKENEKGDEYLVDTSVWIEFLNGKPGPAVDQLKTWLMVEKVVGLTATIYQEILQGAASEAHFQKFQTYFSQQPFCHPLDPVASFAEAARIYFLCRRRGLTIRSTTDCLIARVAIEHNLVLLHNDRDFESMATVIPALRLA